MKRKMTPRLRRVLDLCATVVMIGGLLAAGGIVGVDLVNWWRAGQVQEETQALYRTETPEGTPSAEPSPDAQETQPDDSRQFQEDFRELYETNPDVVGWLTAGETIDLPVVQRDNAFYLNHNFFGEWDSNGTVFLNEKNSIDPRDHILLLHGHNMPSGKVFGRLLDYAEESYMRAHALITFRTLYEETEAAYYIPVAGFDASMMEGAAGYFDISPVSFSSSESCRSYLDAALERSYWTAPADVSEEDELLLLVTCSYNHEDGRFLLLCRRLRDDETPEGMRERYAPADTEPGD